MRRPWVIGPLLLLACSSSSNPVAGSTDSAPSPADAGSGAPIVDAGSASVPFTVASYPNGNGKYFSMQVSVNGTPFNVLLDTGSSGLRVFSKTRLGTPTGDSVPVTFGGG